MDAIHERELFEFIIHEARLLDERRWEEWLALFADEGRYWVPLAGANQADGATYNSLADEDRLLLALRIERLKNPRAHSQRPPSQSQHVLQQPTLVHADAHAGRYELRTPFIYVESRGAQELMLSGTVQHCLVHRTGRLHIALKRVDLLQAGAALPAIQLFP